MHQTRKTHNAHNETQRRLRKLVKKTSSRHVPKHVYYRGEYFGFEPDWDIRGSSRAPVKIHGATGKWGCTKSLESLQKGKGKKFYVKRSKSSWGHFYKKNKKYLHRLWRRIPLEEPTYSYKQAKGESSAAYVW